MLVPPWWDDGWVRRRQLVVTIGPTTPDKGYAGYTVRYAGDPADVVIRRYVEPEPVVTVETEATQPP